MSLCIFDKLYSFFLKIIAFKYYHVYLTMNITPAKTREKTKREATTIPAVAPDGKSASKT